MVTSFFDKYGGIATISKLVNDSYEDILEDEHLKGMFIGVDMKRLIDHQIRFFSHVLGGPESYDGRQLEVAHRHLGVTDLQFKSLLRILRENLEDLDVESKDIADVLALVNSIKSKIVNL